MDRTNQILLSVVVVIGVAMVVRAQPSQDSKPVVPTTMVAAATPPPQHNTRPAQTVIVQQPYLDSSTVVDNSGPTGDSSLPPLETTLPGQTDAPLPEAGSQPEIPAAQVPATQGAVPPSADVDNLAVNAPQSSDLNSGADANFPPSNPSNQDLLDMMMSTYTPQERTDFQVAWATMDTDEREATMLYLRSQYADAANSN